MNYRVYVDPPDNFHPYACDGKGKCIHCDRQISKTHDPEKCFLCTPDLAQKKAAR